MPSLDDGSGASGLSSRVADYTKAGLASRVARGPPTDADWGDYPPPNGTIVIEGDGVLWVRLGGTWKGTVLDLY